MLITSLTRGNRWWYGRRSGVAIVKSRSVSLAVTLLEPRENPSIPSGLSSISALSPLWDYPPVGYEETHSIVRNESNTVTVDQSGTGSVGTFTIDVVGSADSSDTANGGGSDEWATVTAGGTASSLFTYHLVISGTYADETFAITSETYTEIGSYSLSQNTTRTYFDQEGYGDSISSWSETRSGSYTLSWSADEESGSMGYVSYSYASFDNTYRHDRWSAADGSFSDSTWESTATIDTTGTGVGTADYTGTESWSETHHDYTPDDESGQPFEDIWSDNSTNPLSGTTTLFPIDEPGYDWVWRAAGFDSTDFSFNGITTESAGLTESATYRVTEDGVELDINSFTTTSHWSDEGHVIEDVTGVPDSGSGITLFHRDETFGAVTDVTGSGSYVGGSADATYHAVETGSFAVANTYTVTDEHILGYDEDYQPVDLVFNFTRNSTGGGLSTHTHDYHDSGDGIELISATFDWSESGLFDTRAWGVRNGIQYDESSLTSDGETGSFTMPGDPGEIATPDGLIDAFPLREMTTMQEYVIFSGQSWPTLVPTTPVRGKPGTIQNWYNRKVIEIGKAGEKKVTDLRVKQMVMSEINDTPNGQFPRASGSFSRGPTQQQPGGSGQTFALGLGRGTEVDKRDAHWRKTFRTLGYTDVKLAHTTIKITYAVDLAPSPDITKKRSGNIVAEYQIDFYYTAKDQFRQNIAPIRDAIQGSVLIHSDNVETMRIDP